MVVATDADVLMDAVDPVRSKDAVNLGRVVAGCVVVFWLAEVLFMFILAASSLREGIRPLLEFVDMFGGWSDIGVECPQSL